MLKKDRYKFVISWFKQNMNLAKTELDYETPFQLLVAVVLSAQCTDKRVNLITPNLFHDYPDAESMKEASPEVLYEYIKSCTYPNSKSKYLSQTANLLWDNYKGELPKDADELQKLPGVGRKTAHVIVSVLFRQAKMPVDTHVFRVSARIGLSTNAKNVLETEKQLVKYIDAEDIPDAHHWLILHGRYVCVARNPKCSKCGISCVCKYFEKNHKLSEKCL